jgi:hypothetical protein
MSLVSQSEFVACTESPLYELLRLPLTLKRNKSRYDAGTAVRVQFGSFGGDLNADTWTMRLTLPDGEVCNTRRCTLVYDAPEFDELSADDSVSQSVLGETVEPDGFDSDGSPSWLVALGLI